MNTNADLNILSNELQIIEQSSDKLYHLHALASQLLTEAQETLNSIYEAVTTLSNTLVNLDSDASSTQTDLDI